eukprot:CAMPEP_0119305526 /NCGR_PEP_ID=MMETSP1333-20130426/6509_1 /TAXON_ID=418940 /ORGANISM="Scyphosphaera apsteinii, Strain RCC1455" /LENGTH=480 /DNA_ID=CAMNT_0007308641 /DNA_START=55 /DNA_END=1494 /DNA_ORIENTATION=+
MAQTSYSLLFVVTFGRHLSNRMKALVFFLAFPFAQIVPIFTLLESLRMPVLVRLLNRCGLRPSEYVEPASSQSDSLWTLLQRKYHAHAGFLLEALVEAIPQCSLQLAALVFGTLHDGAPGITPIAVWSIFMSLAVICSKGWLVAYSLHRPSFAFNCLCVAADVTCLFASIAWLTLQLAAGQTSAAASAAWLWCWLLASGVVIGVVGGFAATLFSISDDHLKARHPVHTGYTVSSILFELYIVRLLCWILSVLPCIVLLATVHLALLPTVAFKSLSSEHARHHTFFTALFNFVSEGVVASESAGIEVNAVSRGSEVNEAGRSAGELRHAEQEGGGCANSGGGRREKMSTSDNVGVGGLDGRKLKGSKEKVLHLQDMTSEAKDLEANRSRLKDRLRIANSIIEHAHADKDNLLSRLGALGAWPSEAARRAAVDEWARTLGGLAPPVEQCLHNPTESALTVQRGPPIADTSGDKTSNGLVVRW